ncbi:MAG: hypothetical protein FJY56_19435 [Betaproteobacteria bacterium]|nr:hypothetical protein [Betaproteobacteria bacterium]
MAVKPRLVCGIAFAITITLPFAAAPAPAKGAADAYPNKPIRIIVPYPPGAGTDFTAREIGRALRSAWSRCLDLIRLQ